MEISSPPYRTHRRTVVEKFKLFSNTLLHSFQSCGIIRAFFLRAIGLSERHLTRTKTKKETDHEVQRQRADCEVGKSKSGC